MADIVHVGSASGTTSVAFPAHQPGDLIVLTVARSGSTTQPTVPTAGGTVPTFITPTNGAQAAQTSATRLCYFIATASNHTSGTWTNAGRIVASVYRGPSAVGAVAAGNGAVQTITFPALTRTDVGSWIGRSVMHRTSTTAPVPTGYTQRHLSAATPIVAANDSNGTVGSNPTTTTVSSSVANGWIAYTYELLPETAATKRLEFDTLTVGTQPSAAAAGFSQISATGTGTVVVGGPPGSTNALEFTNANVAQQALGRMTPAESSMRISGLFPFYLREVAGDPARSVELKFWTARGPLPSTGEKLSARWTAANDCRLFDAAGSLLGTMVTSASGLMVADGRWYWLVVTADTNTGAVTARIHNASGTAIGSLVSVTSAMSNTPIDGFDIGLVAPVSTAIYRVGVGEPEVVSHSTTALVPPSSTPVSVVGVTATSAAAASAPVVAAGASVVAVTATSSAAAIAPTVSASSPSANVTAARATATALARVPGVGTGRAAARATATALARVPGVGTGRAAARATATALARVPGIGTGRTAARATASALARVPGVGTGRAVARATATAMARPPVVSAGGSVAVTAPRATASALARVPVVAAARSVSVVAVRATSTAQGRVPVVRAGLTVTATRATASALGRAPALSIGGAVAVVSPRATASAAAPVPAVVAVRVVAVLAAHAAAAATGRAPTVRGAATVVSVLASSAAVGRVPLVRAGLAIAAVAATAHGAGSPPGVHGGAATRAGGRYLRRSSVNRTLTPDRAGGRLRPDAGGRTLEPVTYRPGG